MTVLYLYKNQLSAPIPAELGQMEALTELWPHINPQLTGQEAFQGHMEAHHPDAISGPEYTPPVTTRACRGGARAVRWRSAARWNAERVATAARGNKKNGAHKCGMKGAGCGRPSSGLHRRSVHGQCKAHAGRGGDKAGVPSSAAGDRLRVRVRWAMALLKPWRRWARLNTQGFADVFDCFIRD
jgi:hypothetical protein